VATLVIALIGIHHRKGIALPLRIRLKELLPSRNVETVLLPVLISCFLHTDFYITQLPHVTNSVKRPIGLDSFQLVCATNRSPDELIKSGSLREDFFYRIATILLHVPPLRERYDDVVILAEWFLKRFKVRGGASYPGNRFDTAFLSRLYQHSWPGNVRELRNVVERAVILSSESVIGAEQLPESLTSPAIPDIVNKRTLVTATSLPENPVNWPRARLVAELRLALEARQRVQEYKGNHWKAEFMRLMYPDCKAANAKGFDDLIKRLTQGPWGYTRWTDDSELRELIEALRQ